jgi:ankyrin repeat protein
LWTDLLIRAAKVGHVEAAKVLLEKPGIRVLLELPLGPSNLVFSALHLAAPYGHSGIVRLLPAKPGIQIDREAANTTKATPLYLASHNGHLEVVKILLDAGADKDKEAATSEGCTPLQIASERGHFEVTKVLLDAGADHASLFTSSQFVLR